MPRFVDLIEIVQTCFPRSDIGGDMNRIAALARGIMDLLPDANAGHALLSDYCAEVAAGRLPRGQSHHHPNGFDKLSLYRLTCSDARIRLHIWWDGVDSLESTIHDHRWHFASYVLKGKMAATNFRKVNDDEPGTVYQAVGTSDIGADHHKQVTALGQCRLRATASYTIRAGDVHTLHAEVPHQVFGNRGQTSATIVITAPPIRDSSITYRERIPEAATHHYAPFAEATIFDRIESLLDVL